jgi:putative hemolysin
LYFEEKLQELKDQHTKELDNASNLAFERFKKESDAQLPEEYTVLKIDDLKPLKAMSVLPPFDA